MRIERKNYLGIGLVLTMILLVGNSCNFSFSVGKPKEPTSEDLQKLVKATLEDFTESLEKDDFEIIRKKASSSFQQQYTAEQIKSSFKIYVDKKNLAVPLFQDAQDSSAEFSMPAKMTEINEKYFLETQGKFSTQNQNVNFHFEYAREDGKWKITKFQIKT